MSSPMVPRTPVPDLQIAVRFANGPGDVLFDGLDRDSQALRHFLVGTLVEDAQREGGATLRRQAVYGFLDEAIALVPDQPGLQRLAFVVGPVFLEIGLRVALYCPLMAVFIGSEVASGGEEEGTEHRDRVSLPVGAQERFLDDFLRGLPRADKAPDITGQSLPTLGEELRENFRAGLRCRRHCRGGSVWPTVTSRQGPRQLWKAGWGFSAPQVSYAPYRPPEYLPSVPWISDTPRPLLHSD